MPRNRLKNNDVALFLPLIFLIQLIYNRSQVAPELVNKARELNKNYRLHRECLPWWAGFATKEVTDHHLSKHWESKITPGGDDQAHDAMILPKCSMLMLCYSLPTVHMIIVCYIHVHDRCRRLLIPPSLPS
jgi:hypothetical protein